MKEKTTGKHLGSKQPKTKPQPTKTTQTTSTPSLTPTIQQTATYPSADDVLSLQRTVGNQSVQRFLSGMIQRLPAGSPGARPLARQGHSGEHVGVLQQKLNAARAATPPLVIDALFGPLTRAAVVTYQGDKGLVQDGVVGPLTWGALDTDAPGGGRDTAGAETHVDSPDAGNPVGVPDPGTSIHPTVGPGASGPAVEELQEKLNGAGAAPPVPVDGQFSTATGTAVSDFQNSQGIPATGVADGPTWARLDAVAPGSSVGRVERQWGEEVGGQRFGMTSRYTWRINPGEIRITVNIAFTGLAPKNTWFGFIRSTWNLFKAVETTTNEEMNIEFDPQQVSSGADNTVDVAVGPGRANAAQWFLTDPDEANTIPHEFGHMVGLQDEYQLTAAEYERTTGHMAPVGELTSSTGATAASLADQLHDSVTGPDPTQYGADAHRIVRDNGIRQGAFAQQVASSYQSQFSQDIVRHMAAQIPDATPGTPGADEFEAIDPFTYSSGSVMGDPSRHPDAHDHGVQSRHVREFVEAIQANKGGTWEVRPR